MSVMVVGLFCLRWGVSLSVLSRSGLFSSMGWYADLSLSDIAMFRCAVLDLRVVWFPGSLLCCVSEPHSLSSCVVSLFSRHFTRALSCLRNLVCLSGCPTRASRAFTCSLPAFGQSVSHGIRCHLTFVLAFCLYMLSLRVPALLCGGASFSFFSAR